MAVVSSATAAMRRLVRCGLVLLRLGLFARLGLRTGLLLRSLLLRPLLLGCTLLH